MDGETLMADGLRSLKYGIGDQTTSNPSWTKQDLKNIALLVTNIISPAYDIQEYQKGVEQTLQGNLWGIPQSLAGLLGIAIPGSKYIRQGPAKVRDVIKGSFSKKDAEALAKLAEKIKKKQEIEKRIAKEFTGKSPSSITGHKRVYHGTGSTTDPLKVKDNILYVSPSHKEAGQFAGYGTTMMNPNRAERIYPLKIANKNMEKIFDPSNEKHLNKLKKDPDFKNFVELELNNFYDEFQGSDRLFKKSIKTMDDWINEFKKNTYWIEDVSEEGKNVIAATLEDSPELKNILKKNGFEGFTILEGKLKNIGIFLDEAGNSKILKSVFEKNQGGMIIRNPYNNYNERRAI
jgi:hypothetical protein